MPTDVATFKNLLKYGNEVLTLNFRAQLQLSDLPLQKGVDPRQVLRANMRQQNRIDSVEVTDQLPETCLGVRAAVHQHCEPVNGEKGTVATARGEHVAAGTRQLEKAHGGGRRQELKGRLRGESVGDEGGELAQGLHGGQHLRRVDEQSEGTLQRLVSHQGLPPLADVGAAEGQAEFGGGGRADLIYELNIRALSHHTSSRLPYLDLQYCAVL